MSRELVGLCQRHEYNGYLPQSACELCALREMVKEKDAALASSEKLKDELVEGLEKISEAWATRSVNFDNGMVTLDFGVAEEIETTATALISRVKGGVK